MTTQPEPNDPRPEPDAGREHRVFCRRLQRMLPVPEHRRCPYCFGDQDQIKQGWYRDFCDFDERRDPVNFGFPPDSSRNLES